MSATMSIQRFTQKCLDKFQRAMVRKGDTQNQSLLENRLAGFSLWADNIRDITKPGASLDSGVQSRPDELKLAKNILKILDNTIDRYVGAFDKGLSTEEALASIDSAIENLAKIGVAIHRADKESRRAGEQQETDETSDSETEDEFANNSYFEDKRSAGSLSRQNARGGSSIFRYFPVQDKTNDPKQTERDLNAAVSRGDEDAVRSLIKSCQNFDTDGKIRRTAFRAAVQGGHIAIVKQLLGNGADVDSRDEHGQTALFFAIEQNDKAMVQCLIESGIDVHIKDYEDLTALHIAVRKGTRNNGVISTLFTTSVYQRFTDDQLQKAISWAKKQGHLSAAKLLRYESILSHAQRTFDIKDRTAAAKSVIQGNDWSVLGTGNHWYTLLDPLLVPLHFDLVGTFQHDKELCKIAFSRDGKYIATSDRNRTVRIFDVKTRRNVFRRDLKPSRGDPSPICFSSDGRYLLFGSLKYIEEYDMERESTGCHGCDPSFIVSALDVSKDGCCTASGGSNGTVRVCPEDGESSTFSTRAGRISRVEISPDCRFVAACGNDGYAYVWNLRKNCFEEKFFHGEAAKSVTFSSDGRYLATAGIPAVKLWDLDNGTCVSTLGGSGRCMVEAMSMTSDDKWIITASYDGSIRFWHRQTGKSHCIVDAHKDHIRSAAISLRGGYLATVSGDKTVRIWSYGPRRQT